MKSQQMPEAANEQPQSASPAIRKTALGALLFIAFLLRAWQPSLISVEHFDEGVYASNFYSSHLDYSYPNRHLYAPPLFPALLEWLLIFTGNPHSVVWVNIVLGTGLVAAIWWLTKLVAGEAAAMAAAAMATFNDFFITYSRAVLTDTPVCLFIVLAVASGLIAIRDDRRLAAVAAAIFTGLAWWTKYNGWLPLAILGAGLAGWIVFKRPQKKDWMPRTLTYVFIAAGAIVLWLPYLWSLQDNGGYAAVAKNHSDYIVGFEGWLESLQRQLLNQDHYSELTMFGYLSAVFCFQFMKSPHVTKWNNKFWILAFFIVIVCAFDEPLILMLTLSIYGLVKHKDLERLGFWILLAWFIGLFVSTPLYRPYPRLMMLLSISVTIASALGIAATLKTARQSDIQASMGTSLCRFGLLSACIYFTLTQGMQVRAYEDRSQIAKITSLLTEEMQQYASTTKQLEDLNAIIYVIGEPGLYYHLASRSAGRFEFIAQPASNLGMLAPKPNEPNLPTFLVLGLHAEDEKKELAKQDKFAELVEEYEYKASDLVLLDDYSPKQLEANRHQSIELWKLTRH